MSSRGRKMRDKRASERTDSCNILKETVQNDIILMDDCFLESVTDSNCSITKCGNAEISLQDCTREASELLNEADYCSNIGRNF